MILNILQDFVLALFVVFCFWIIFRERNTRTGIAVYEGNDLIANGKQGLNTSFGRAYSSDVRVKEKTFSRFKSVISYSPERDSFTVIDDNGTYESNGTYVVGNHAWRLELPRMDYCFEYGTVVAILACLFVALQAIAAYNAYGILNAMIPHLILIVFLIVSTLLRADKQPIAESIFCILLTYYNEATVYATLHSDEDVPVLTAVNKAILGVAVYCIFAFVMSMFLKIDFIKYKKLHTAVRVLSVIAIGILILINIIFGYKVNGTFIWVNIAGIQFSPGELIKVFLALALICPFDKRSTKTGNTVFMIVVFAVCAIYGMFIKDVGTVLQYGVIFVAALVIQNLSLFQILLMIPGAIVVCKGITLVSSTAATRINEWLGETSNLFDSFTSKSVFNDPTGSGYQQLKALLAAFKNSGLFGNDSFDILEGVEAASSDIVMSFIAQRHGFIIIFLILALFAVLILNTVFSMRQKNKFQQVFAGIAAVVMVFAALCNIGGGMAIIPFTGTVLPFLSDGTSSAISYGCMLGALASTSMNHKYLNAIKRKGEI